MLSLSWAEPGPTGGGSAAPVGVLAGLVARRGERARLLDTDNSAEGWIDVAAAASSGVAFFVEVAPWILALDADTHEASVALEDLATDLIEHGHRPVVVASGRPGNRHLFVVLANEAHRSHWARLAASDGIDVRRHIRPPLSPHRNGRRVELIYPGGVAEAVDSLAPPPQVSGGRRLSANMASLLRHGQHPGRSYTSRSEIVQALATGALNAGWNYARFQNALLDPNNLGGARYQEMLARDYTHADRWLQTCWTKAEAFVGRRPAKTEPSKPMLEVLASIRTSATNHRWPGRTASTDRAIFLALCDFAESGGQISGFAAGVRAVGIEAGVSSPSTARKALRRLTEAGWIRQLHQGSGSFASLWALSTTPPLTANYQQTSPHQLRETNPLPTGGCEKGGQVREVHSLDPGNDAFRWASIGKSAGRLLEVLETAPEALSTKELAGAVGMSPGGTWRVLQRLETVEGLIQRSKQGRAWHYALSCDLTAPMLDTIAEEMGQAGRREQERTRYADEMAQRRRWEMHSLTTSQTETAHNPTDEPEPQTALFDPDKSIHNTERVPQISGKRLMARVEHT